MPRRLVAPLAADGPASPSPMFRPCRFVRRPDEAAFYARYRRDVAPFVVHPRCSEWGPACSQRDATSLREICEMAHQLNVVGASSQQSSGTGAGTPVATSAKPNSGATHFQKCVAPCTHHKPPSHRPGASMPQNEILRRSSFTPDDLTGAPDDLTGAAARLRMTSRSP